MKPRNGGKSASHLRKKLYLQRIAQVVSEAYRSGVTYNEAQAICGAAWGDYLEAKVDDDEIADLA